MIDLRKIAIIFVIAALYAVFVFTLVDAISPRPDHDKWCIEEFAKPRPYIDPQQPVDCPDIKPTPEQQQACSENRGYIKYEYDNQGCVSSYECNCKPGYRDALEKNNLIQFVLYTFFALIAVGIGLFLPERNTLNEWVGTGFMLGGLVSLFIGTAQFFGDIARPLRPVIILVELLLVLFLAYKKLGDMSGATRDKRK